MMKNVCLLLLLSVLSACAAYTGRGIPAPVEERGASSGSVPATTPAPAPVRNSATVYPAQQPRVIVPPAPPVERPNESITPTPSYEPLPLPTPVPEPSPGTPATASSTLIAGVDAAIADGDLERAAALCERALRINPRDASLWYRLASVRARQGRVNEAEGFARRALSFSADDPALTRQINTFLQGL